MDTAIDIIVDTSSLEALHRSEIDQQISTAKAYPRSVTSASLSDDVPDIGPNTT